VPTRVPRALAALEAALALEEEEGDVPSLVLVEHQMDTRRKQKLLLSQLRVLKLLLGVIENPGLPLAPTNLREAAAQARRRWQELKARHGEAGGSVWVWGLQWVLSLPPPQQEELKVKVSEARERRDQLLRRVQERRLQRLHRQEALQGLRETAAR
ncbi:ZWINT protein, partial [Rhabdornis inornatus]|nr:ZWINT protein [Rhabdornis inornatus]